MAKQKPHILSEQRGMVSIVTTMILMIVISLIVVGFSQIVRRNTRQVLDAQLSSQAFYAAESGLNLAAKRIAENNLDYLNKVNCDEPTSGSGDYKITNDGQTTITCLLTHNPDHLKFDSVGSTSRVSLIKREDGASIDNITITWQDKNNGNVTSCPGSSAQLPANSSWTCQQPLLRVDLVPVTDTGNNRNTLIANQFTAFLYPNRSAGSGRNWSEATNNEKGNILDSGCTTSPSGIDNKCKMTISIPGSTNKQYAIRMMSLYKVSDVIVYTTSSGGGRPILVGGQVVVDSTARSIDVVKRIRARVSVSDNNNAIPDFAIDSGSDICKRYKISGGTISTENPAVGCSLP